jgi:hypothetical protein
MLFHDQNTSTMFIRNGPRYIEIKDPMQAINLEIKFNLTPNGKIWSRIGDALFDFKDIEVNASQFSFIKDMVTEHLNPSSFNVSY